MGHAIQKLLAQAVEFSVLGDVVNDIDLDRAERPRLEPGPIDLEVEHLTSCIRGPALPADLTDIAPRRSNEGQELKDRSPVKTPRIAEHLRRGGVEISNAAIGRG